MYTLRSIQENGTEMNQYLGDKYIFLDGRYQKNHSFISAYISHIGEEEVFFCDEIEDEDKEYDIKVDINTALNERKCFIRTSDYKLYYINPETQELEDLPEVYGFIAVSETKNIPLYKRLKNFIMTDTGNTFANISYKE